MRSTMENESANLNSNSKKLQRHEESYIVHMYIYTFAMPHTQSSIPIGDTT